MLHYKSSSFQWLEILVIRFFTRNIIILFSFWGRIKRLVGRSVAIVPKEKLNLLLHALRVTFIEKNEGIKVTVSFELSFSSLKTHDRKCWNFAKRCVICGTYRTLKRRFWYQANLHIKIDICIFTKIGLCSTKSCIPDRRDTYEPLNRTSSWIVRVAAASAVQWASSGISNNTSTKSQNQELYELGLFASVR